MYIVRRVIAKLLETQPSNIQNLKQVEDNIYVKLRSHDDEFFLTVEEYQTCWRQLRSSQTAIDWGQFLTIATVIGILVVVTVSSMHHRLGITETPDDSIEFKSE